jgi:hypothetical protein
MKKFRQLFIGIIIGAFIFSATPISAAIQQFILTLSDYKVVVDGKEFVSEGYPILMYKGVNYTPLTKTASALGASISVTGKTISLSMPTPAPTPTPTPAPTPTPNTSTTPILGTRLNPLSINQPVIFDGMNTLFDTYKVELTLMEIVRGNDALAMAKQANMFNHTPPLGKEYLFAKFKILAIESKNDDSIDVNSALFDLYSTSGVEYDDFVVVSGLQYKFTEIFPGAETLGYACFYVDINDTKPNIAFQKMYNQGIWFRGYN